MAEDEGQVIRYAGLLRGTESAWQAISYGLCSVTVFAQVGAIYINFGLLLAAIVPAWFVLRHFGKKEGKWDSDNNNNNNAPVVTEDDNGLSKELGGAASKEL